MNMYGATTSVNDLIIYIVAEAVAAANDRTRWNITVSWVRAGLHGSPGTWTDDDDV